MRWIQSNRGKSWWMVISLGLVILLMMAGWGDAQAFQGRATPTPRPTQPPGDPAIRIIVDESYLNKLVIEALEEEADLSRPVVNLRAPDAAEVTVSVRIRNAFTVRPTVTLAFDVVDEQVQTEIRGFDVNGLPIPRSLVESQLQELKARMEQEINQELVASLDQSGLELVDVSATDDALIIDLDEETPPIL